MSGARIIFPEFRDEQLDSRYPFADTATLIAATGFELPRTCFVDVSIYAIGAQTRVYMSSIEVTADAVIINIGDSGSSVICSATYSPLNPPADGLLDLTDAYGRPAGILVSSRDALALLGGWAVTSHSFTPAAAEFVSSVVAPAQEAGVRGLFTDAGKLLTGDVWLIGDRGVVLREKTPGVIRVDIVGTPLFKRVDCLNDDGTPKEAFLSRSFIRTINGCGPDEYGNFTITVATKTAPDSVLRIYPENGVLKIDAVGTRVL
jgi:hypothetical protein